MGFAMWVEPEIRLRLSYDVWAGKQMSQCIIRRDQGRCASCGQPATSMDHLLGHGFGEELRTGIASV
jgi:5-methylcytosine-specific restriction endonuclease McrA